jgi:ketosteroid isomerase-like protein
MKRLLIALFSVFLVSACTQSPPSADPSVITDRADEWEAALNAKDIDALVELYEVDARMMAPNKPTAIGRDAVAEEFGAMIDAGLSVDLTSVEAVVSGDYAYNVGTYVLMEGDTQIDTGKYMESWHRGDDGQWRYTNDIYNSDHPAAAPEPAPMTPMSHLMITHEVEDADRWLEAWRGDDSRHKLFSDNGAAHVHTFQTADNPNMTGLVIAVTDMGALTTMLESEQGLTAAAYDGVKMETMKVYTDAK